MFYNDSRVLYFSIHRFEHGTFWPNLRESDYDCIGEGNGLGYNFNLPLNKTGMTNADYLAIWQQILLPVAAEVKLTFFLTLGVFFLSLSKKSYENVKAEIFFYSNNLQF